MVRQEWKKLLHNKILLVVILAVIAIPSIYTTLFLGSMWDPYGNTDKLPVAVVNEDQPVEYQGAALDIGGELVKKLKEEKDYCELLAVYRYQGNHYLLGFTFSKEEQGWRIENLSAEDGGLLYGNVRSVTITEVNALLQE